MNRVIAWKRAEQVTSRAARRWLSGLLATSVAAAALIVAIEPADARHGRRHDVKRSAPKKDPPAPVAKGQLLIAVSIGSQRLTVYDDGVPIAHSPVSTGTASHPTPTGVFSIIQKNRHHRSNIYSGAPMPFMQRITWSGVALHAGVLPGYPASHGCIRLPNDFAARLWGMTRLGARVVVTRSDVTPGVISHARLTALQTPAMASTPERRAEPSGPAPATAKIRTAEASDSVVASDAATPSAAPPADAGMAPASTETTGAIDLALPVAGAAAATPTPEVAPPATEVVGPVDSSSMVAALPIGEVFLPPERPARALRAGPVTVFVSRQDGRLYVRKRFDPLFSVPVAIKADRPIGTHVFTAAEGEAGALRWVAVSLPAEPPSPVRSTKRDRRRKDASARRQPDLAPPVPPSTAAEALDRVELSPEVLERIAGLMSPGASLIISDKGLGYETGLETDFIVLSR